MHKRLGLLDGERKYSELATSYELPWRSLKHVRTRSSSDNCVKSWALLRTSLLCLLVAGAVCSVFQFMHFNKASLALVGKYHILNLNHNYEDILDPSLSFLGKLSFWKGWKELYYVRGQASEKLFSGPLLFPDLAGQGSFVMCMVPKNGCTTWKRVNLRMQGYEYLDEIELVHHSPHLNWLAQLSPEGLFRTLASGMPRVAIARNPYSRLLSAYLDKIRVDADHPQFHSISGSNDFAVVSLQNAILFDQIAPNSTFGDFVRMLHRLHQRLPGGLSYHNFINVHYAPQYSLCGEDVGLVYHKVLRIEEVNQWYSGLVGELQVGDMMNNGWPGAGDCFFSPPDAPCPGPYGVEDATRGVTFVRPGLEGVDGVRHATNATALLLEHYDAELAALVTEMYKRDFVHYGYPMWDGRPESLLLA